MSRKTKKETSPFVKLAIFAFAVFAVITVIQLQLKLNEYEMQRDVILAEVMELQDAENQLKDEVNAEIDDDYIIEKAKEKLNLRLPEEIIFYNDLFS